jgi:hypothetical protein
MNIQFVFNTRARMRKTRGFLKFFNDEHPELLKGEVFLCNANEMLWQDIDLETKRRGKHAYFFHGEELGDKTFFPVFVKKSELRKKNIRCR